VVSALILAGTGHRPDKLGKEYRLDGPVTLKIAAAVYKYFDTIQPSKIITGMAIGFDQILAICAIHSGIKFTAAIPFKGQELKWPTESQKLYRTILENKLATPIIICEGEYAAWKMQRRNEWMVDEADKIIACWDGSDGGTGNCVKYAQQKNKEILRINPKELAWV
jgi:uncharacterized phage-like protein YoqJ